MSEILDRDRADAVVERLRALTQPQRLMILAVLLDGERAVGEIEATTGIAQPALSQQLGELRRAGLVTTRREARMIFYSVADEDTEERVRALFAAFGAARPVKRVSRTDTPPLRIAHPVGAASFARIG